MTADRISHQERRADVTGKSGRQQMHGEFSAGLVIPIRRSAERDLTHGLPRPRPGSGSFDLG